MKRNNLILVLIGIVMIGFVSCKRDKLNPYDGPQACPGDGFSILTNLQLNKQAPDTVNFQTTDELNFQASFSENARWKITITGNSSHAYQIIEGFSKDINTSWYGRSRENIFFTTETVAVKFEIVCRPELTSEYLVNIKKTNFQNDPTLVLLQNFNTDTTGFDFYVATDPTFGNAHAYRIWCPVSDSCVGYHPSQEGGGYSSVIGISPIPNGDQKNTYGDYEVYPNLAGVNPDPNKVWFNLLVNTQGTPVKVSFDFRNGTSSSKYGRKVLTLNTSGWEVVSFNMGQLTDAAKPLTNTADVELMIITIVQSGGVAPTIFNMDIPNFTSGSSFSGMTE